MLSVDADLDAAVDVIAVVTVERDVDGCSSSTALPVDE